MSCLQGNLDYSSDEDSQQEEEEEEEEEEAVLTLGAQKKCENTNDTRHDQNTSDISSLIMQHEASSLEHTSPTSYTLGTEEKVLTEKNTWSESILADSSPNANHITGDISNDVEFPADSSSGANLIANHTQNETSNTGDMNVSGETSLDTSHVDNTSTCVDMYQDQEGSGGGGGAEAKNEDVVDKRSKGTEKLLKSRPLSSRAARCEWVFVFW